MPAAALADFQLHGQATGFDGQWPSTVKIIQDLYAAWLNLTQTGAFPDNYLTELILGTATQNNVAKLAGSGTNKALLQLNTGTEAVPVWTTVAEFQTTKIVLSVDLDLAANALLNVGALTLGGDLDLGGNDIDNVGDIAAVTLNGVNMSAHVARHQPGGADAMPVAVPVSVGPANAEGASTSLARANHVHQGMHALRALAGGTDRYGDLVLANGTRTTVTNASAQEFKVNYVSRQRAFAQEAADRAGVNPTLVELVDVAIPGADGVLDYELSIHLILVGTTASLATITVHVGPLGTASDPTILTTGTDLPLNDMECVGIPKLPHLNPAAGDKVSIDVNGSSSLTVKQDSYLVIQEFD